MTNTLPIVLHRLGAGAFAADALARLPRARRAPGWAARTLISSCALSARSTSLTTSSVRPLAPMMHHRLELVRPALELLAFGWRQHE